MNFQLYADKNNVKEHETEVKTETEEAIAKTAKTEATQ
jgi:hypothetical protein